MKKLIRSVWFALVFATNALLGATDVGQVIHIDVDNAGKIVVDGKTATPATLSPVVSSLIQDKEHTAVEIKAPEKLDKATLEQIKDACRKAGISKFSLVTKH